MLNLKLATDPLWVNLAEKKLEDILTDHAYCEQKAASACISLIQLHPEKELLVEKLAPIVSEEWSHFRLVLKELKKRNLKLGIQRRDLYVNEILKIQKKGGSKEDQLLEKLLTAALIEARSCERFRLLSIELTDEKLRNFYHTFMVSEAGHYTLFMDLAYHYIDEKRVKKRWQEYIEAEVEILNRIELKGEKIH
jgi:tRNA-(ms[2]io[6]A)-hydroxylase